MIFDDFLQWTSVEMDEDDELANLFWGRCGSEIQGVSPASILQVFQDNQKLLIPFHHLGDPSTSKALRPLEFGLLHLSETCSIYFPHAFGKRRNAVFVFGYVSQGPCDCFWEHVGPYLQVGVTHGEIEPKLQ